MRLFLLLITLIWICCGDVQKPNTYLGASLDIFKFFGDLSKRLRTTPRNDTGQLWLFRDPITYAFNYDTNLIRSNNETKVSLKLELCDDISALYSTFFRGIKIEGVDNSWRGFTGSWTPIVAAKKLGIPENYVTQDYSYVLITIDWYTEWASLNQSHADDGHHLGELTERAAKFARQLTSDDMSTLHKFITNIGSHYISSYMIGEGIFQVYVLNRKSFGDVKTMMKSPYVTTDEILKFFCSLYSNTVGQIMVKSGDSNLTRWLRKTFKRKTIGGIIYPSHLLELYREPKLLSGIKERIRNKVLMKLNLTLLNNVCNDTSKKDWFKEVVDNRLKLYEVNI